MESSGSTMVGRIFERVASWVALALLIGLGVAIWQMPGDTKAAIWSGFWRTTIWLALVAAIPWSAQLFIGRVLDAGTNWAGVVLISAFVVLDVIIGIVLMSAWPASGWAWFATLVALALAGTYNYLVAAYLADTRGP